MDIFVQSEYSINGKSVSINPVLFEAMKARHPQATSEYEVAVGDGDGATIFAECRKAQMEAGDPISMFMIDVENKSLKYFKIDGVTRYASTSPLGDFEDKVAVASLMLRYLETDGPNPVIQTMSDINTLFGKTSLDDDEVDKLAMWFSELEKACSDITHKRGAIFRQAAKEPIPELNFTRVESGEIGPAKVVFGRFEGFKRANTSNAPTITMDECRKKFKLPERDFTEEERELMEPMPSWYVPSANVVRIATKLHRSWSKPFHQRINNILMEGPMGTGKSSDAQALADMCNRPFGRLPCFADMDVTSILGQYLIEPQEGPDFTDPDDDSIELDPVGCFEEVTGKKLSDEEAEKISADDVYRAIEDRWTEYYKTEKGQKDPRFVFYMSMFVKAYLNGWFLEVVEPTCVQDAAVLMVISTAIEKNGVINLPTRTIRRHPDCVIIMTTNRDYEGCRPLNQALRDRFNLCLKVELPPIEEQMARLGQLTGCTSKNLLRNITESIQALNVFLEQEGFNTAISLRSMQNFVEDIMDGDDVMQTLRETIVWKITTAPDEEAKVESFMELSTNIMYASM